MATTIYDVAGAAKVSLATVSRVMNNPEKVNPETRERVLKVIEELSYKPNAIARGLASRKSTTVGIVLADISRASTSQLLGGIIDIAKKYEYSIKIFSITESDDAMDVIDSVVAERVDGVLFLDDELEEKNVKAVLEQIKKAQIPVVLCNVMFNEEEYPSVAIDYDNATYEVTKDLINSGKKDIYLFSTVRRYSINTHKEAGYIKAMEEASMAPRIFRTSGDVSINTLHFEEFLNNNRIDAAISVRDSIAVSFINVAIKRGFEVPKDIEVIGLQNTKYAILSRPNLTCVDTPVYDIGAVSMRLLTKFMKQETVDEKHVLLPYRLIRRETY